MVRPLALLAASSGLLLGLANPAAAASEVTSGWWTSAPVAFAPDAPEGQLLVQGGPSDPLAYAGISFVLEEDEEPETLTLSVAEGSASTPTSTLVLCALDAPATEAAGEPSDGAPAPDCAVEVEAAPSDDGTSYTFDVSGFAAEGALDVAVVPSQPTDRVVLEAPTVASLGGAAAVNPIGDAPSFGGSDSPSSSPSPSSAPSSGGSVGLGGGSGGSFSAPRTSPSVSVPPTSTASPSASPGSTGADDEVAAPREAPTPFEPVAATGGSAGGGFPTALLFVALAAAAGTLWTVAGNGSTEPAEGIEAEVAA